MDARTIIALDPSSRVVGFAVYQGGHYLECGLLTPRDRKASVPERVANLCSEARSLVRDIRPDVIVVEVMAGRQYASKASGRTTALPPCAFASGAVWQACQYVNGVAAQVEAVLNTDWTRGISKAKRQIVAKRLYHPYDPKQDRGADASDALCLLDWWLRRNPA